MRQCWAQFCRSIAKRYRGFESTPLRHAVRGFRALRGKAKMVRMLAHSSHPRAPEKLRFSRRQLIYARFSLSRTEPVPLSRHHTLELAAPLPPLITHAEPLAGQAALFSHR